MRRAGGLGRHLLDLAVLIVALVTLLFILLPVAGDPAEVLAGVDATPEEVASIRAKYGLDQPLVTQYAKFWSNFARLDFGTSLVSGQPAMEVVLSHLPSTLILSVLALILTVLIAMPLGAWLGLHPERASRRLVAAGIFILQGVPGFVVALVLIQVFAVGLGWMPSIGYQSPISLILPTIALASFLMPKLCRVVASNVTEALREDYVRTARAYGATFSETLWQHALPNALLGASALLGTQFAFLVSGAVIIERIFSWPGIGWLLIERTQTLDFPVIQALTVVVAVMVFVVNTVTDLGLRRLDPRIRRST